MRRSPSPVLNQLGGTATQFSPEVLVIFSLHFHLFTGLPVIVDFLVTLFLEKLIAWQVLLHLVVGHHRSLSRLSGLNGRRWLLGGDCRWLLGGGCRCRAGRRLPDDRAFVVDVHYLVPSFAAYGHCIHPVLVPDDSRNIRGIRNMRFPDHRRLYPLRKRGELNVISAGNWT